MRHIDPVCMHWLRNL
ncbi:TPA: hypothetical protein N0F65_001770 [Lagenidium giganteum]|uniref:Uncharacterized protein n=1 Tax=Lagenidium giganteum TaxID=4803 RepID=A0AAV2Z5Z1_9STRA|nr:TPA: hypothetical protein N0F65_001770 [Lagenidium giganteum]